jgi:DNA mismatch repair protein MutS2
MAHGPARALAPGDAVHIRGIGSGRVRALGNGGRVTVEIKGRAMVVDAAQVERAAPARRRVNKDARVVENPAPDAAPVSLDLHGHTVDEAIAALDAFINDALLASAAEARVIHGRSGGRLKAAVHRRLRDLRVRSFRVDPRNPGVTIVAL